MDLRHDLLNMGVNLVTAAHENKRGGLTVAWACQAAQDQVLICVGQQSFTRALILASHAFGLNTLAREQLDLAKSFGTRSTQGHDKFAGLAWHPGPTGSPLLEACPLSLDCRVETVYDREGGGKIILGRVAHVERRRETYEPLIYREQDY
jgi:3-hydroxy-9,10-secoandrosta-1,3,5(10)-triene-9,17-dione monooxygenase reductase component